MFSSIGKSLKGLIMEEDPNDHVETKPPVVGAAVRTGAVVQLLCRRHR